MQFRDLDFKFDGIKGRDKQLKIVNIDNKNSENIFGIDREINEENIGIDEPLFLGVKKKCPSIPITLMKMNNYGIPKAFKKNELLEICRWLFKEDYRPFISYDNTGIVHYVLFTKGRDFENCAREGYINLEMRLSAPYGYSNQLINFYEVRGKKIIDIYNNSNLDQFIYPDIEFELLSSDGNIEIINSTTNQKVIFTNLDDYEHIYVYNDALRDVVSLKNNDKNIYKNFNKEWMKLAYGKNRIKIIGNCKIKFISQIPIALT